MRLRAQPGAPSTRQYPWINKGGTILHPLPLVIKLTSPQRSAQLSDTKSNHQTRGRNHQVGVAGHTLAMM